MIAQCPFPCASFFIPRIARRRHAELALSQGGVSIMCMLPSLLDERAFLHIGAVNVNRCQHESIALSQAAAPDCTTASLQAGGAMLSMQPQYGKGRHQGCLRGAPFA